MSKLRVLATTAALAASIALGGCVTLFPKTKEAQLYRFGDDIGAASDSAPAPASLAGAPVNGLLISTGFTRAAEGDRILTVSGAETAYIAQSRWVSPASVLFDEAASRAFERPDSPFRLMRRGDIGRSNFTLRIDVESFEADYEPDWKGAPNVVVRVRALLMRPADHGAPVSREFMSTQHADENRVSDIVKAYNAATADVLGQVVTWTTYQAGAVNANG